MNREATEPGSKLDPTWPYRSNPGFYDEIVDRTGAIRPHWRSLAASLLNIGHESLARRWAEGRRLIHEHGVTYNVYSDPQSTDRPWPLDPVPMLIGAQEWAGIEAAITQRATLLNAVLADLYGPQALLRSGKLPVETVFPNPHYLRPCRDIEVPGGVHLHVYAADIARSPDGRWWVIADRTQAPSGAGYALENRLVSSRVMPDVYRSMRVQRLAGYFQKYREMLLRLVRRNVENPRVVLLTPGPYNETYFEHAFLARYLGYTLVEGGDLSVHDNRVYLKTLGGLLPVDVILRRQDDSFCDPLELNPDSMLGVPGLVQAVRSGNVVVANALGSGLVETASLSAFLEGLCRHMLGEALKMPSVATWWCGHKEPFDYVTSHLDQLVVKPAFPSAGGHPVFGAQLSAAQRKEFAARIQANPMRYVAQEQVAISTVPVWEERQLVPRHLVLRVYAVASGGSYAVMPGGLTRVTSSLETLVVSMQHGGGSKDTWVLADEEPQQITLLQPRVNSLEISRATFDLPSRVADNLYWLGRYTERVEAAVRIVRALLLRLFQETGPALSVAGQTAVPVLQALGYFGPNISHALSPAHWEREVLNLVFDSEARSSLAYNVHHVRRLAWLLRDRISADAWRILNQLDQQFTGPAPAEALLVSAAQDRLNDAVITLSAFSGMVMESMTHGDGWRFLDIGRRLERSLQMTELLRHGLVNILSNDAAGLQLLLEIADCSITYRSRYLNSMQT
ncbi:MAG: circularly permuted type 2 ATP-grasp protein, partial [Bryobacterales bacterium]|nr:circularly permuted type 2 ATP-grasp protein [Bryobacterales bacterium]